MRTPPRTPRACAAQLRESFLSKEAMANRPQTYDAIRKLLASLDDPFTRFLEPSRLAALRRGTAGAIALACSRQLAAGPDAGQQAQVQQQPPLSSRRRRGSSMAACVQRAPANAGALPAVACTCLARLCDWRRP